MKNLRLVLLISLFLIVFISCSKDNNEQTNTTSYFIKAKFNGEEKIFSNLTSGEKGLNNGALVHVALGAVMVGSSSFPAYDIEIWNTNSTISEGEYSESSYQIQSRYAINGTTRYSNFANTLNDYKVTITLLSPNEIKGTFEGTITNSADNDNINITSGEFYLPLKD